MRDLSQAKFSFVTRGLGSRAVTIAHARKQPAQGDLVVARVEALGQHDYLEDRYGRRVRLYAGDLVVERMAMVAPRTSTRAMSRLVPARIC